MLKNTVSLITGASSGIGRSVAHLFASEQSQVCAVDINNNGLDSHHYTFVTDICKRDNVIKLADDIFEKLKRHPTIIVNAAGITRDSLFHKMKEQDFDDVINVNLKGTFLINQIFCQKLLEQQQFQQTIMDVSIINIASIVGKHGNIGQCNYSASKAGVEAMTKSMAKEISKFGIRCNTILPGFIQTPMTDKIPEKIRERVKTTIGMQRFGQPEEIASVCLFLASKASSYVNGASIEVTGGL
ncbi:unnamed protein product [Didymodactylos carnosus]|uniref:(3R)-3-hydroxyacyl-CoA dehydrogenase n=1 Tax=Didymodactylos carnosus TaxID=1234261 RepID=A0A813S584_9BILA|nr:unnamed protein product [Didymodactylos carnosus]CAF0791470.1 unnamed protein product [Didymodactylos carnosus]CAF3506227.1 unnamed protein product [Didymodactylos carnosus]CAF3575674.1 unnamed protein product [Didymodactylos carnosus]